MDDTIKNDLTLTRRAARGQWNVPARVKQKSVEVIENILHSGDPELKLDAIKTAAVLDKIDLKEVEIYTPKNINVTQMPTKELLTKLETLLEAEDTPLLASLKERLLPKTTDETQ